MTQRAHATEERRQRARDAALDSYDNGRNWANALWLEDALWGVEPMLAIARAKAHGDDERAAFIEHLAGELGYWNDT